MIINLSLYDHLVTFNLLYKPDLGCEFTMSIIHSFIGDGRWSLGDEMRWSLGDGRWCDGEMISEIVDEIGDDKWDGKWDEMVRWDRDGEIEMVNYLS